MDEEGPARVWRKAKRSGKVIKLQRWIFFFSISLSRELFHGIKENFQRATEPVKADNISSVLSGLAAIFSD